MTEVRGSAKGIARVFASEARPLFGDPKGRSMGRPLSLVLIIINQAKSKTGSQLPGFVVSQCEHVALLTADTRLHR